jgi:hypothetical protein
MNEKRVDIRDSTLLLDGSVQVDLPPWGAETPPQKDASPDEIGVHGITRRTLPVSEV